MAELLAKAARGPVVQVSRQSVGEYLTGWLELTRPTLSPAAWTNYRTCVDRYVRPWLSAIPLGQLTGAALTRHYALLLERGGHKGRPAVTDHSAHRAPGAQPAELHGLPLSADLEGPEYVSVADHVQPLHPQRLTDLLQRAAAAAGVPVIRLHDARHSCATLALDAGVHPKVVQQLLGHSSWSTTMDLYSHRVDRLQREATQRIETLLLSGRRRPVGRASRKRAEQRRGAPRPSRHREDGPHPTPNQHRRDPWAQSRPVQNVPHSE
jgi:hypothetical protein